MPQREEYRVVPLGEYFGMEYFRLVGPGQDILVSTEEMEELEGMGLLDIHRDSLGRPSDFSITEEGRRVLQSFRNN